MVDKGHDKYCVLYNKHNLQSSRRSSTAAEYSCAQGIGQYGNSGWSALSRFLMSKKKIVKFKCRLANFAASSIETGRSRQQPLAQAGNWLTGS